MFAHVYPFPYLPYPVRGMPFPFLGGQISVPPLRRDITSLCGMFVQTRQGCPQPRFLPSFSPTLLACLVPFLSAWKGRITRQPFHFFFFGNQVSKGCIGRFGQACPSSPWVFNHGRTSPPTITAPDSHSLLCPPPVRWT